MEFKIIVIITICVNVAIIVIGLLIKWILWLGNNRIERKNGYFR